MKNCGFSANANKMIVEFSVQNFRSIKELQTLTFVATGLKSPEQYLEVDDHNIRIDDGTKLLKTIGIYGANASGKSNFVRAFAYFLLAIRNEPSPTSKLESLCDPFKYQNDAESGPAFFQIVVIHNSRKFRYGFTVRKQFKESTEGQGSFTEIIEHEWLYVTKEKNMSRYFERKGMEVEMDGLVDTTKIPALPYAHTLFLTHDAAFQANSFSSQLRNYLGGYTVNNIISEHYTFRWNALRLLENENGKDRLLKVLSEFGLPYDDISLEKDDSTEKILRHDKVLLKKSFRASNNEIVPVELNLAKTESSGTQKLFDIIGLLLRAFVLRTPTLIIIDEIDSNFHPSLLIKMIKLFNDPQINVSNSQLLFTSHDTNLMSPAIMRRDQFYFTEKGTDQSSRLYSLSDLKGIRNDADFARQYLLGYYGAVPLFELYSQSDEIPKN